MPKMVAALIKSSQKHSEWLDLMRKQLIGRATMTGLTCSSTKHNIKLMLSLFNLCTKTSVRENALRSLLPSMDSVSPATHPA